MNLFLEACEGAKMVLSRKEEAGAKDVQRLSFSLTRLPSTLLLAPAPDLRNRYLP